MDDINPSEVQLDSAPTAPTPVSPNEVKLDASAGAEIPADQVQLDPATDYETLPQQIGAGLEGAAQGLIGPLAPLAEKGLSALGVPNLTDEDIKGRAEANPLTHTLSEAGAMVGGAFVGVPGIAGAIAKGAEAATAGLKLAEYSKLGAGAAKMALEAGLFQASDEVSKALIGQGDPEEPVASALTHVGAAGLFGGALGGLLGVGTKGLAALAETKAAQTASKFLTEMGGRWDILAKGLTDRSGAVADELSSLHNAVGEAAGEAAGPGGLKNELIHKLAPAEMNEAVVAQKASLEKSLDAQLAEMQANPRKFAPGSTAHFEDSVQAWKDAVGQAEKPADIFQATEALKREMGVYSKFGKSLNPGDPAWAVSNSAKKIGSGLRQALEDESVWGGAGKLQAEYNAATSQYLDSLKAVQGDLFGVESVQNGRSIRAIDPKKVEGLVKGEGKTSSLKTDRIRQFVDASERYEEEIANLYNQHGLKSPVAPTSLHDVKQLLGYKPSPGAAFADYLHDKVPGLAAKALSATGGALFGGGAGALGALSASPLVEKFVSRPVTNKMVPVVLKLMSSGSTEGLTQALTYAGLASKGAAAMSSCVDNVFSRDKKPAHDAGNKESEHKKIKEFLDKGGVNGVLQSMPKQPLGPRAEASPQYAEGGEVKQQQTPAQPAGPEATSDGIAAHFPEQASVIGAAQTRASQYLLSLKPRDNPTKLPFDRTHSTAEQQKTYDRAIELAANPLKILNHIKDGSLTPDQVKHLNSMYPEVHRALSKRLTEKITQAQMKGEMPSYHKRQALSLFLGAPLDSSLTPASIQAAQSTFKNQAQQPAPNMPVTKNKRNTSHLGEASANYQTIEQARLARQASQSAKIIGK